MIDEKEIEIDDLRIGNLVILDTGHSLPDIHVLKDEDLQSINNGLPKGCSIKPIRITEELVLKLGFKKEFMRYYYKSTGFYIFINQGYHTASAVYTYKNEDVIMNNAHQLQNLYFALTGKELTFKQS